MVIVALVLACGRRGMWEAAPGLAYQGLAVSHGRYVGTAACQRAHEPNTQLHTDKKKGPAPRRAACAPPARLKR
jgi:hypothetical protein